MMGALRDKAFLRTLAMIALPIALQNLITYSVNLMDTIMLGMVGEVELSAASMAGQLFFVLIVIGFGIASGSNVLIAQYWGKGDKESIKKVLAYAYRVTFAVAAVFSVAALCFPTYVVRLFTPDPAVIAQGASYLRITGWSCVFTAFSNVMLMTLRPMGTVGIALVCSSTSLVVNTFLNWVFIFGNLGAPAMGIRGAAVATLTARVIEFSIVCCYMLLREKNLKLRPRDLLKTDAFIRKDFVSNCMPVLCNEMLWSVGTATIAAIIGRMGTGVMAAAGIYNAVIQVMLVAVHGLGNATAVLVGNTIGAGLHHKLRERVRFLIAASVAVGVVMGSGLFVARPLILSIYNITAETYAIAMEILAVGALVLVFQALANICLIGVLRGGGDVRFVLFCDTAFLWVVSIPLGAGAGLVLGWAPAAVYAIIKSDEIFKTIFALGRITRGKWVNDVTR